MHIHIYICIYMYMSMHIYTYMCIYIYIYTDTHVYVIHLIKRIALRNKTSQRCTSCFDRSVVLRACPWLPPEAYIFRLPSFH